MAFQFKDSFLARLFGSEPKTTPESEPVPEIAEPAAPVPQPAVRSRHEIQLPPGHAMNRLWELSRQRHSWLSRPSLYLEGPGDEPLPDRAAQKEQRRLQMKINVTANQRLDKIYPKNRGKDGKRSKPPRPEEDRTADASGDPLPDLDAQAAVIPSGDGLMAWLLAYPPMGQGRELDQAMLADALREQNVSFGVDQSLLDRLPQDSQRYFHLFVIARGTPPVPGVDGRVVDLFPRTAERTLAMDEHGRVDYTAVSSIRNVDKGDEICRIIPPTKGVPGCTVTGGELHAKDGRPASVPRGRNTQLSEDGGRLLATLAGHVEFVAPNFQVKPLLEISGNVDYSTGNINFLGDVLIHGDICSGFSVRAMGSVTVEGVVEACSVEAGGDLVVAKGVQGDDRAVIRTQRSLIAKYLENSCIYVKETIRTDSIISCDVYCDGSVEVRSGRMTILGGTVRAAHEVSAGVIGSQMEGHTNIFLGGLPCGDFDYEQLTKEIQEFEAEMEQVERRPDSPDKLSRMSRLRMQLIGSRGKLGKLDKERARLASNPKGPGIRRMVCDVVYPGTALTIGNVTHHFENRLTPCSATLADGEIRLI